MYTTCACVSIDAVHCARVRCTAIGTECSGPGSKFWMSTFVTSSAQTWVYVFLQTSQANTLLQTKEHIGLP